MPTVTKNLPRRVHLELQSPAEKAIRDALAVVESMPADERLTNAVTLLDGARESVADYVDEHHEIGTAPQPASARSNFEALAINICDRIGKSPPEDKKFGLYDPTKSQEVWAYCAATIRATIIAELHGTIPKTAPQGGSNAAMAELNQARNDAQRELG